MKLLSFAIPCYNSAAYMEKCIKSCLAGGDDVEIIIVDDGSTKDDTLKIANLHSLYYALLCLLSVSVTINKPFRLLHIPEELH